MLLSRLSRLLLPSSIPLALLALLTLLALLALARLILLLLIFLRILRILRIVRHNLSFLLHDPTPPKWCGSGNDPRHRNDREVNS